tara:strand:+ start:158 stop:589 length:432 start_codon:yes stop_codon:yes gene_type:complete
MFYRQNHNLNKLIKEIVDYNLQVVSDDTTWGKLNSVSDTVKSLPKATKTVPDGVRIEDDGELLVMYVDMPGVKKKDVNLSTVDGMLFINAEQDVDGREYNIEHRFDAVWDLSTVDAEMTDGLLVITMGMVEAKKPKVTTVKIK